MISNPFKKYGERIIERAKKVEEKTISAPSPKLTPSPSLKTIKSADETKIDFQEFLREKSIYPNFGPSPQNEKNMSKSNFPTLESAIKTIFIEDQSASPDKSESQILPDKIRSPLIKPPKLTEKMKREWLKDQIIPQPPKGWIKSSVASDYAEDSVRWSSSTTGDLFYSVVPSRGILVVSDACPFYIELLTHIQSVPVLSTSAYHQTDKRNGDFFNNLEGLTMSPEIIWVIKLDCEMEEGLAVLDILSQTPYAPVLPTFDKVIQKSFLGGIEMSVVAEMGLASFDFICVSQEHETSAKEIIDAGLSTLPPSKISRIVSRLEFGKGNKFDREALWITTLVSKGFMRPVQFFEKMGCGRIYSSGVYLILIRTAEYIKRPLFTKILTASLISGERMVWRRLASRTTGKVFLTFGELEELFFFSKKIMSDDDPKQTIFSTRGALRIEQKGECKHLVKKRSTITKDDSKLPTEFNAFKRFVPTQDMSPEFKQRFTYVSRPSSKDSPILHPDDIIDLVEGSVLGGENHFIISDIGVHQIDLTITFRLFLSFVKGMLNFIMMCDNTIKGSKEIWRGLIRMIYETVSSEGVSVNTIKISEIFKTEVEHISGQWMKYLEESVEIFKRLYFYHESEKDFTLFDITFHTWEKIQRDKKIVVEL